MRNSTLAIGYLLLLLIRANNCSNIIGNVTVGLGCKIHSSAQIVAHSGAIVLGTDNHIGTQVRIENVHKFEPLVIGNNNTFESKAHCQSASMGNNNLLERNSYIGPNVEIGNNCIVGANCRLTTANNQTIGSYTEVHCPNLMEFKTCLIHDANCKTFAD